MSVYIIDKCERFVSQRAGCGKAASPDSVRGVRPQGVRLLDRAPSKGHFTEQVEILHEKRITTSFVSESCMTLGNWNHEA